MNRYIFFTRDGFTYDSLNKETNNMQLLGHGEGDSVIEAFDNFKTQQSYISSQSYINVMAMQTIGDVIMNLEL